MIALHVAYAIPLLVMGWIGIHMKNSAIGGAVAILIAWQGILALAALSVFRRANPAEGAVLLWWLVFGSVLSLGSILVLGLRRYYADRDVSWRKNEEIRN
jgi:hypothetical protein